jgi:hypothetical protein
MRDQKLAARTRDGDQYRCGDDDLSEEKVIDWERVSGQIDGTEAQFNPKQLSAIPCTTELEASCTYPLLCG